MCLMDQNGPWEPEVFSITPRMKRLMQILELFIQKSLKKLGLMKSRSDPTFLPFPDTFPLKDPAPLALGCKNLCYSQESSPCLLPNNKPGWNFPKKNCEIPN